MIIDSRKDKLRILLYGEPYKWAMAFKLKTAWHAMGHEAQIFDWTQWQYRTRKFTLKNRILDRVLYFQVAKKLMKV